VPGLVRTRPNGFLLRIRDASREESGRAPVGA
jgi:hypothetical protein